VACGLLMYVCRDHIGEMFTTDGEVNAVVRVLAPIAALFQVLDGFVGVCGGVFRGLGRQKLVVLVNVLAFWLLGMPLGYGLAFPAGLGVSALWWGLSLGLLVSSAAYAVLLLRIDWLQEARDALIRSTIVSAPADDLDGPVVGKAALSAPLLAPH